MVAEVQTDRLGGVIDKVRQNLAAAPEPPIATFAVTTSLVNEYETRAQIRDFSLTVDEPEQIGGNNTGPTPVELVLAALGTCQEIVYATYARVLGIPLNGVEVAAEGRLDLRGFFGVAEESAGFKDVSYTVTIDSPASQEEISRLVAAVNAHCPVLDILQQPVPVTGTYRHNGVEFSA